jgi:hypothetical protein
MPSLTKREVTAVRGVVRDEVVGRDRSGLGGLQRDGLLQEVDERVVHAASRGRHRVQALGVGRGG